MIDRNDDENSHAATHVRLIAGFDVSHNNALRVSTQLFWMVNHDVNKGFHKLLLAYLLFSINYQVNSNSN